MPRIRKKTTNRASTNDRAKVKHKVRESRKKNKKQAKKNPQWKSKQKKDPGIPNNFPYKDQILAEIAAERRQLAEEKQKRKDEKKATKSKAVDGTFDAGSDGETETPFDGVRIVKAGLAKAEKSKKVVVDNNLQEDDEAPMLINHDLPNLKSVLDQADVLLEVLDARDPLSYRSSHLEELASARPTMQTLLVLNKIDTCPREAVSAWATQLRKEKPTVLFRSASAFLPSSPIPVLGKGKAKERADDAIGAGAVIACLMQWAKEKGDSPLTVVVAGITNSGKSSFINSLLRKPVTPIYTLSSSSEGPTTTTLPAEITLEISAHKIRFIDTAGLSWQAVADQTPEEAEATRARDILLRSKGRVDKLKDPLPPVVDIVSRADTEGLMLFYNLPAFPKGDTNSFLAGVARSHSLVKKGGSPDLAAAARIVLHDWSIGKFPYYTVPPPSSAEAELDSKLTGIYERDETILASLKSKKDMRKSGGLVKFVVGEVGSRRVAVDAPWRGTGTGRDEADGSADEEDDDNDNERPDGSDEESAEVDDDDDGDSAGADEDNEDEDGDDADGDENDTSDEDEEIAPIVSMKGKRKRVADAAAAPPPPAKKVLFAPDPKESRQARRAASKKGPKSKTSATQSTTLSLSDRSSAKSKPKKLPKTNLKATQKPKPKARVANVGSTTSGNNDSEAYDFGKFF